MEHCLLEIFCIRRGWATVKYIPFASTGLSLSDIAYAMYVVEYLSLISACKFGLDIQVDLHQVLSATFGVSVALFSA